MKANAKPRALLLGMVYSDELEPKRGQEYRDRVRCAALENIGYEVHTLDNKHTSDGLSHGKHCQANFADCRRMEKNMIESWGRQEKYDCIILDYFFSPAGWARERWTDRFFEITLPAFAARHLTAEGQIWLPNLDCVQESLAYFKTTLTTYFSWRLVDNARENPLYLASEDVEEELLLCPDSLTNETQLRPLLELSKFPFYVLEVGPFARSRTATSPAMYRKRSRAISAPKPVIRTGRKLRSINRILNSPTEV